jgi:hypothetical protein
MSRPLLAIPFVLLLACDTDEPGDPPEAPRELEVAAVTGGAHITWMDASDDEDEFAIERKGETGGFVEIDRVPFDTTQYHDGTATTGTWVYRVGATNDGGENWSADVSVTIE